MIHTCYETGNRSECQACYSEFLERQNERRRENEEWERLLDKAAEDAVHSR